MSASGRICLSVAVLLAVTLSFSGGALSLEPHIPRPIVNLQIDADGEDADGLRWILSTLEEYGVPAATLYIPAEFANDNARLLSAVDTDRYEVAFHGFHTGEQLATMTYDQQRDRLRRGLQAVVGCIPCGFGRDVRSFRPQYFSQNEDTLRVISELGIRTTSGYRAHMTAPEGYDPLPSPYFVREYGLSVVPISATTYEGSYAYLCDISAAYARGMSAEAFMELVLKAVDENTERGDPTVLIVHDWFTGMEADSQEAFIGVLSYLSERDAIYTTTGHLGEWARYLAIHQLSLDLKELGYEVYMDPVGELEAATYSSERLTLADLDSSASILAFLVGSDRCSVCQRALEDLTGLPFQRLIAVAPTFQDAEEIHQWTDGSSVPVIVDSELPYLDTLFRVELAPSIRIVSNGVLIAGRSWPWDQTSLSDLLSYLSSLDISPWVRERIFEDTSRR